MSLAHSVVFLAWSIFGLSSVTACEFGYNSNAHSVASTSGFDDADEYDSFVLFISNIGGVSLWLISRKYKAPRNL